MKIIIILAVVLMAAGILGLIFGGFNYTKTTHTARIGTVELSAKEKRTVTVPVWACVGMIAAGGSMLALQFMNRKRG